MKDAELSGFVQRAESLGTELNPIEIIPTMSAWAIPSGPLSHACFETLTQKLLEGLDIGPSGQRQKGCPRLLCQLGNRSDIRLV